MTPARGCSDPSWPCLQPVRPAVPPCQGCWVWPLALVLDLALDLVLDLVLVLAVGFGCCLQQHAKRKPQTNHLQSSHLSVIPWWWWQVAARSSRASHLCTLLAPVRQGWQGKAWWGEFRNRKMGFTPSLRSLSAPSSCPCRALAAARRCQHSQQLLTPASGPPSHQFQQADLLAPAQSANNPVPASTPPPALPHLCTRGCPQACPLPPPRQPRACPCPPLVHTSATPPPPASTRASAGGYRGDSAPALQREPSAKNLAKTATPYCKYPPLIAIDRNAPAVGGGDARRE